MVLENAENDRLGSTHNNVKACNFVHKFMEVYNLSDIWRERHPEDRLYTWCKKTKEGIRASRLDMFLISVGTADKVTQTQIVTAS